MNLITHSKKATDKKYQFFKAPQMQVRGIVYFIHNRLILNLNSQQKSDYFAYLVFITISCALFFSWFRDHTYLASGEEGLLFYSASRILSISYGIWHNIDLGLSTPLYLTRIPLFYLGSILEQLSINGWIIQACVFIGTVFVGLLYSWKSYKLLMVSFEARTAIIASVFYLCNLFVMSQVFARFILSLVFLWGFLPVFVFYFVMWLKEAKARHLLYFGVFNTVFSQVYLIVSPVLTLWIPAIFYFLVYERNKPRSYLRLIMFGAFWLIINIWWIVPFLHAGESTHATIQNNVSNMIAISQVSNYFSNADILTLSQKYYFSEDGFWSDYYNSEIFSFISNCVLALTLFGLVTLRRLSLGLFLGGMFLFGWFFSKGTNPPFGYDVYSLIFTHIPLLQAFRNPYEKLGVVFVFAYAALFSVGITSLTRNLTYRKVTVVITICFLSMFILVLPLWNAKLFRNYEVNVPAEYSDMNEKISSIGSDFRILHMPYQVTGDAKLAWAQKTVGINESLFDNSSYPIQALQGNEDFYQLLSNYTLSKYFTNILKITSTCCVLLHDDIIFNKNYFINTDLSRESITQWEDVRFSKKIGKLELYTLDSDLFPGKVFLAKSLIKTNTLKEALDNITSENFNITDSAYYVSSQNKVNIDTFESTSLPKYKITKKSNAKYVISVSEATESYVLVLANNYNSDWDVLVDGQEAGEHFEVNGFANGWVIRESGSYDIELFFKSS